jgi:hypothetical protein
MSKRIPLEVIGLTMENNISFSYLIFWTGLKLRLWTLMYIGSALCATICVILLWRVTVTGNLSLEPLISFFFVLGMLLFTGGYLYENRYKREHQEEFGVRLPEE